MLRERLGGVCPLSPLECSVCGGVLVVVRGDAVVLVLGPMGSWCGLPCLNVLVCLSVAVDGLILVGCNSCGLLIGVLVEHLVVVCWREPHLFVVVV